MATQENPTHLTGKQVISLAASIGVDEMQVIAEIYMGFSPVVVKNLLFENNNQAEAFNREVIRIWANKNPQDQIQVSDNRVFL